MSVLRLVLLCSVLGACADSEAAPSRTWYFADLPTPSDAIVGDSVDLVATGRTYGTDSGPGLLGRIGRVVVREHWIYVYDETSCEIVIFPRDGEGVPTRHGRCGQGPDEYRGVQSIVNLDDRLYVYDEYNARVSILDSAGQTLDHTALVDVIPLRTREPRVLLPLANGHWLVVRATMGKQLATDEDPRALGAAWAVGLAAESSRSAIAVVAVDDSMTRFETTLNYERPTDFCVTTATLDGTVTVYLQNIHAPQFVRVQSGEGALAATSLRLPLAGYEPFLLPPPKNAWERPTGYRSIGCDGDQAVLSWRSGLDSTGAPASAQLLLVDSMRIARPLRIADNSLLTAVRNRVSALSADRVFFAKNILSPYPALVEARLITRQP